MYSHIHGGHSTLWQDPRITPLGRFIRKTSIDELPQLLNVLRGEMSLVGPRPNVSLQMQEYTQDQWDLRNSVLPGITGLAQVEFRSLATQNQRLECDLYYVKNQSFFLDMHILVKTFFCFFSKKGN